jgi:hypothetical protein
VHLSIYYSQLLFLLIVIHTQFQRFNSTGDLNDTDPKPRTLAEQWRAHRTMALLPRSPAIDTGNPSSCTNGHGHLLKTDQRGKPRPDKEDSGGCDRGAYERQKD